MPETVPAPPEGMITLTHGSDAREMRQRGSSIRGVPQPIDGVLVYVEGGWHPVTGFGPSFRRTMVVYYAGSKLPGRTHEGHYTQRVAPERVAVRPELIPQVLAIRANVERSTQEAAARAEQIREERDRLRAERAAQTPTAFRIQVQEELIDGLREQLARAEAHLAELRAEAGE